MIDIKTDGMVEKKKKTGDLKMWSQDRVGGREADRDYTDFNTDQIQIIHGAVSVHVTRDWHGKTAHSDGRQ